MVEYAVGFIGPIGSWEMMAIMIIAVLLFGKRLPEVGRSLGKGLTEFKKGIRGIEDEVNRAGSALTSTSTSRSSRPYNAIDDRDEATAPKFEPPASANQDQTATT